MQLENNMSHIHYKKVVVGIALFIVVAIIGFFVYYYFSTQKAERIREAALQAQYKKEQQDKIVDLFAGLGKDNKPLTDEDKKKIQELYKGVTPETTTDAEAKAMLEKLNQQSLEAYQEWKAAQQ